MVVVGVVVVLVVVVEVVVNGVGQRTSTRSLNL